MSPFPLVDDKAIMSDESASRKVSYVLLAYVEPEHGPGVRREGLGSRNLAMEVGHGRQELGVTV